MMGPTRLTPSSSPNDVTVNGLKVTMGMGSSCSFPLKSAAREGMRGSSGGKLPLRYEILARQAESNQWAGYARGRSRKRWGGGRINWLSSESEWGRVGAKHGIKKVEPGQPQVVQSFNDSTTSSISNWHRVPRPSSSPPPSPCPTQCPLRRLTPLPTPSSPLCQPKLARARWATPRRTYLWKRLSRWRTRSRGS